jgi:pyridoxine 5-phosphate synthase
MIKLGINIDHIATVRQARREGFPDPTEAALLAVQAGADGITAHLREDRRHIQDSDIFKLKEKLSVPLNMEMAAVDELIGLAHMVKPAWACLVPEQRHELTTEGGLNVADHIDGLTEKIKRLHGADIKVSLIIEPSLQQVAAAKETGADAIEIHTGIYAKYWKTKPLGANNAQGPKMLLDQEIFRIKEAALEAQKIGLLVNAGHGIDYENIETLTEIFEFNEFNIGFAVVARALYVGLHEAVAEMKRKCAKICVES